MWLFGNALWDMWLKNEKRYFVERLNFYVAKLYHLVRVSCDLWKLKSQVISRTWWVTKSISSAIMVHFRCTRQCNRRTWHIDQVWRMTCSSFVEQCSRAPSQIVFLFMFSVKICHLNVFKGSLFLVPVNSWSPKSTGGRALKKNAMVVSC